MTPRDGLPPEPGGSNPVGWLPRAADALFGDEAEAAEAYGLLTVDVPAGNWVDALTAARDELGCTYFDWLSAVDEPGLGFRICAHLVALPTRSAGVRRLLLRTTVPHEAASLPTATGVYAGAAWHERETHEMFGLDFTGHPGLDPLLLPDGFEGHPLRKDFVLAARVVKAWPGAKEPGESGHGGGRRRQMLPPGVPDPNEWGPQAGRAPATDEPPARPRRARSASAGSASQRPEAGDAAPSPEAGGSARPRRSRSASGGSASQRPEAGDAAPSPEGGGSARPRRARSASGGSASQRAGGGDAAPSPEAGGPARPRRSRSASGGSASQRAGGGDAAPSPEGGGSARPRRSRSASGGSASQRPEGASGVEGNSAAAPPEAGPRRTRSASGGSASQRAGGGDAASSPEAGGPARPRRARSASGGSASQRAEGAGPGPAGADDSEAGPRSTDAPWHHARPAFEDDAHDGDNDNGGGDDEGGEA